MSQADAACQPHERLMFNLAVVHFLLPAILFATEVIWLIVGVPMVISILIIISIYLRGSQISEQDPLVLKHWQLAWQRSQYLLWAYLIALVLFGIAAGISLFQQDATMRVIELAVAGWFALLPISVTIVVLFILEGSALVQARQGIYPAKMKL